MLFDTDMFIWVQRGNLKAAPARSKSRPSACCQCSPTWSCCKGAENRRQRELTKSFLRDFGFITLPLTENIGHRAAVYVEEYGLSHGVRAGDAIIAATAAERGLVLCTSNAKHFLPIKDLKTKIFRP